MMLNSGCEGLRYMTLRPDIQAVLFDLDGTLLDRRRSFARFARNQWDRFASSLRLVDPDLYVQRLIQRDQNGYAPREELFTGFVDEFDFAPDLAEDLLTDYRASFPRSCLLFPDVTETLVAIRLSGMKLGLITNGSVRMQSGKIRHLSLSSMFDTILISETEGISKPDAEIFHRALQRLAADPSRAVFVGDHPEVDVSGARSAGLQAVWRRDPTDSRPVEADATIENIGELLPLLGLKPGGLR